jgi:hypothetical protein
VICAGHLVALYDRLSVQEEGMVIKFDAKIS